MDEEKSKRGRPLKFKSVEELQEKIEEYFNLCEPHPEEVTTFVFHTKDKVVKLKNGKTRTIKVKDDTREPYPQTYWVVSDFKIPTVTGLAIHLGTTRQTLVNYELKDEFLDTIKRAKSIVEEYTEKRLHANNPTGVIFSLKNNFGWRDVKENINTNEEVQKPLIVSDIHGRRERAESEAEEQAEPTDNDNQ